MSAMKKKHEELAKVLHEFVQGCTCELKDLSIEKFMYNERVINACNQIIQKDFNGELSETANKMY